MYICLHIAYFCDTLLLYCEHLKQCGLSGRTEYQVFVLNFRNFIDLDPVTTITRNTLQFGVELLVEGQICEWGQVSRSHIY